MNRKEIINVIPEEIEDVKEYVSDVLDGLEATVNTIRDYLCEFGIDNLDAAQQAKILAEQLSDDLF